MKKVTLLIIPLISVKEAHCAELMKKKKVKESSVLASEVSQQCQLISTRSQELVMIDNMSAQVVKVCYQSF